MRFFVLAALAVFLMPGAFLMPGVAVAAPSASASPTVVKSTATTVCTITDSRPIGLSGLIVTKTGFIAISDSNLDKSMIRIWYFDKHCKVVKSIEYPTSAFDPEDAAIGRDGTLYVADIGDNDKTRSRIAVWKLAPGHSTPQIFRYAYPDGAHDAETILLAADDTPIFITKEPFTSRIYVPTAPADPSGKPVPLKKVGTFTVTPTDTPSGVGILGGFVVTGGANSADRTEVALRTYSDAYEWHVPDGDVIKAITTTTPTLTPLPNEPQGESIAYAADGRSFYTISDQETHPVHTAILRYPSGLTAVHAVAPSPGASGAAVAARPGTTSAPTSRSVYLTIGIAAAAIVLLIIGLAAFGLIALIRRRTRTRQFPG